LATLLREGRKRRKGNEKEERRRKRMEKMRVFPGESNLQQFLN
jgi:hypothetical protein